MKSKLTFVIGMGVGYVLGARAGRSSYEKIKTSAKTLWNKDQVQQTVINLQEGIKGQAGHAVHSLVEQVLPTSHSPSQSGPSNPEIGENSTTSQEATPPDIVPEISDEFPDAALDGDEAEKWTSQVRSRRHQRPAGP